MIRPGDTHCHWCHRKFHRGDPGLVVTDDHIVPQCMGGTETVRACRACNELKGDMTPEQWQEVMTEIPGWWRLYTRSGRRGRNLYNNRGKALLCLN